VSAAGGGGGIGRRPAALRTERAIRDGGGGRLQGRESRRGDLDPAEPSFPPSCAKPLSTSANPPFNTALDG
jgi:hypothetical protein